jgi:hypothetical protein
MIAFKLIVPVLANDRDQEEEAFLVPSILPEESAPSSPPDILSARIVFTTTTIVRKWRKAGYLSPLAAEKGAYVPSGLFSMLLATLVSLCQQTEPYPCVLSMQLCRNIATLKLGRNRFTLVSCRDNVEVRVEEGSGCIVGEVLESQLAEIFTR